MGEGHELPGEGGGGPGACSPGNFLKMNMC